MPRRATKQSKERRRRHGTIAERKASMLWCQSVVLGVVAMATLPIVCLSGRPFTWPTPEKALAEAVKNRKGLRHSPAVLMDVMRTPTSVRYVALPGNADQTASFTGGHPHKFNTGPPKILQHPMKSFVVGKIVNKQRKPFTTFKDHVAPWTIAPTLNFAPANALPWHTPGYNLNLEAPKRPSALWHLIPSPREQEPTTTTTPSTPETQESNIVNRYTPSCTQAPASFTTLATQRKIRHHIRLFSNAHQYKRDMDTTSPATTPSELTPSPVGADVQSTDVLVDTNFIDEEHRQSPWFSQLLGQVIAAAEMTHP